MAQLAHCLGGAVGAALVDDEDLAAGRHVSGAEENGADVLGLAVAPPTEATTRAVLVMNPSEGVS